MIFSEHRSPFGSIGSLWNFQGKFCTNTSTVYQLTLKGNSMIKIPIYPEGDHWSVMSWAANCYIYTCYFHGMRLNCGIPCSVEQEVLEREIGRLRTLYKQQQQPQQQPSSGHRRSKSRDYLDSQFANLSLKRKDANSGHDPVTGPLRI